LENACFLVLKNLQILCHAKFRAINTEQKQGRIGEGKNFTQRVL
jgi:hypothetical protein